MRRLHTSAIILLFIGVSYVSGNLAASPRDTKASTYDSTKNFLGEDITKYVGQELYLTEKSGSDREYGFTGFFTKPDAKDENVYRPNDKYYSTYIALAGKYFKVLDVVSPPEAAKGEYFAENKSFLKLQERDSANIVYFEYKNNSEFSFPFIVYGYYQKQIEAFKGKYFVYSDTVLRAVAGKTDIATGKPVAFRTGDTWKCVDVQLPESNHDLNLVIQNTLGEKTTIPITTRSFSLIDELDYKKRFGIPTFNRLLRGEVFPGMTEEMVKISIGEPYAVHSSLTHGTNRRKDDWMYYFGKTLSFDNGKLIEVKDTPAN